jgi:transcription antitermination protein NusB
MVKTSRRECRKSAIIILYQKDLLKKKISELIENSMLGGQVFDEFTLNLIKGVDNHSEEIDNIISRIAENWSLERIAIIDRNILRVAIYEMLYEEDIPLKVSVDEAIEISKTMGQKDDTPKFINGILGKFLNNISDYKK